MAHLYPFTDPVAVHEHPPTVIVGGDGISVIDDRGKRYIDAASALWCASLGFSNERLIEAATRQYAALPYYHNFMGRAAEPADRLADVLAEKLPVGMTHLFFGSSGSEAVDTAVKLARFVQQAKGHPDKTLILAREDAYHGSGPTSAALSAASYMHDGFDVAIDGVVRIGSTHHRRHGTDGESEAAFAHRRAAELDETIQQVGADRVCALIGEPVIGSGGAIPPPLGYWEAVQDVLARHDVMLIADEIITGFGRTGEWFGSETYRLRPHLMTMAKQLTGAYFPMSAVAVREDVMDVLAARAHELGTLGHGFTYGGHPVGAAVALEALAIYDELDLPRHVGRLGDRLARRLADVGAHPAVVEVRHVGLLAGVELHPVPGGPGAAATAVKEAAERRGVIFRQIGDTLAIAPPYIIEPHELDHVVDVLADSIDATIV